jgi:hypothetical protein
MIFLFFSNFNFSFFSFGVFVAQMGKKIQIAEKKKKEYRGE